jgi:hypothetical protein
MVREIKVRRLHRLPKFGSSPTPFRIAPRKLFIVWQPVGNTTKLTRQNYGFAGQGLQNPSTFFALID